MKVTMVIPSYWARERECGWREGDAVYDHPTPLDAECMLLRAIQSMDKLKDKEFRLVIIAAATAQDIEARVEKRAGDIVKSVSATAGVKEVLLFCHSHLRQLHELLITGGKNEYVDLLSLAGYSNIRNMCMFIPHILDSEVAVLIDDDEVFEDPDFMAKATEFIGRQLEGNTINAVAGYYLQPDGNYHIKKSFRPWMKYWDQLQAMNKAFDRFIGTEPRLKETPFVFGGNMVIHRNLWNVVPFDPDVPRGEDIDFLINAKMFRSTFFLDNQLSIRHLPPPKTHPTWMQLRQDIYRFVYERTKIENQRHMDGMVRVRPEDFDPYPGNFLREDLEQKIEKTCESLSKEYLEQHDSKGSEEALRNIAIAKKDAVPKYDPFQRLCELQKRWSALMKWTSEGEVRSAMREVIEGGRKTDSL